MIECLILGDSIGVGVAQHRPECIAYAKVGINSRDWVSTNITKDLTANTVVISLGSNDHMSIKTLKELFTLREVVKAKHVYWILPADNSSAQEAVSIVADKFEDKIVIITELSKDKVHPTSKEYKRLATVTVN